MFIKKSNNSFTLIEVTVTVLIAAITLGLTFQILLGTSDSVTVDQDISEINFSASRAIEEMAEDLRGAYIPQGATVDWRNSNPNLYQGSSKIQFVVPVDYDDNGDEDTVDLDLKVEWGVIRPDFTPGHMLSEAHTTAAPADNNFFKRFSFVENTSLKFDEAARNMDVDGDGSKNKVFRVGKLIAYYSGDDCVKAGSYHNGEEVPELSYDLTNDVVIVGDFDSSLVSDDPQVTGEDPIFRITGSSMTIILHVGILEAKHPIIKKFTTIVDMENLP